MVILTLGISSGGRPFTMLIARSTSSWLFTCGGSSRNMHEKDDGEVAGGIVRGPAPVGGDVRAAALQHSGREAVPTPPALKTCSSELAGTP